MTNNGKVKVLILRMEMDFEVVLAMMRRIYQATKEEELVNAIQSVKDLYYGDHDLLSDALFLEKLIIFEASGQVIPPINLGDAYMRVVEENANN
jgi:hypothetical protein